MNDCGNCTNCITLNDDQDNFCYLKWEIVTESCAEFEHFEEEPAVEAAEQQPQEREVNGIGQ